MNICYFTGTGNSLAICREMQKHFPHAELKPIAGFSENAFISDDSDIVGFVVPAYYMDIPAVCEEICGKIAIET